MQGVEVGERSATNIDASQVESRCFSAVQLNVDVSQRFLSCVVDRAVGEGDEVEVADPGQVVTGCRRPTDEQFGHPAERR
jgi:hypothetical protein